MIRRLLALLLLCLLPTQALAAGTLVYQGGVVTGGGGDVTGPAVSVDNGIVRYDGTTGKLVQSYTSNTPTCGDTGICTFVAPAITTKVNLPRVTALPGSPSTGDTVIVTDDSAIGACDSAAGNSVTLCQYNGASWVALGDGAGAGSLSGLSTNTIPKATSASTIANSLLTDNGTTLAYTGTGGIQTGSGSGVAGRIDLLEGTATALVANTASIYAPTDVAAGGVAFVKPANAASGHPYYTNSAGVMTESILSEIPQNSKSAAYTTVLADAGYHILHPTADNNARTITIDSNANVAYPIGTAITFVNQINTVTIAITSDTMTFYPGGGTGSRTLAANGIATALKISTTGWIITGSGLT